MFINTIRSLPFWTLYFGRYLIYSHNTLAMQTIYYRSINIVASCICHLYIEIVHIGGGSNADVGIYWVAA